MIDINREFAYPFSRFITPCEQCHIAKSISRIISGKDTLSIQCIASGYRIHGRQTVVHTIFEKRIFALGKVFRLTIHIREKIEWLLARLVAPKPKYRNDNDD